MDCRPSSLADIAGLCLDVNADCHVEGNRALLWEVLEAHGGWLEQLACFVTKCASLLVVVLRNTMRSCCYFGSER